MSGLRGRPPGIPKSPNSGKQKGTRNTKRMTTEEIRQRTRDSVLSVYEQLGGDQFLLDWAKENASEFIRQCWARCMAPPMPRENPDVVNQLQVNINNMSEIERARRVAFLMAKAADELEQAKPVPKTIEHRPMSIADEIDGFRKTPPPSFGPEESPGPVDNKAEPLVRDTHEQTLETYRGSPAEWGRPKRNLL